VKLLSFDNFDRRRDVVSCVSFQPALTQQDWDYILEAVVKPRKQLIAVIPEYTNEAAEQRATLAMLFQPLDENDLSCVVYCFAQTPEDNGDWRFLSSETYNELSVQEFWSLYTKRRII